MASEYGVSISGVTVCPINVKNEESNNESKDFTLRFLLKKPGITCTSSLAASCEWINGELVIKGFKKKIFQQISLRVQPLKLFLTNVKTMPEGDKENGLFIKMNATSSGQESGAIDCSNKYIRTDDDFIWELTPTNIKTIEKSLFTSIVNNFNTAMWSVGCIVFFVVVLYLSSYVT